MLGLLRGLVVLCAVAARAEQLSAEGLAAEELSAEDGFFYAGKCNIPGERCIITKADNPLPLAKAPRADTSALTFLSLGDWGCGDGNCEVKPDWVHMNAGPTQAAVAEAMGSVAEKANPSFILALGDNFYFQGVKSKDDPLFQTVWQNRFTAPALQVPWFGILGNHDHYGNAQAQIDFSKAGYDKRWIMPNYYWTTVKAIPNSGQTLQLVMIDTVILDEGYARAMLQEKIEHGFVGAEALAQFDARRIGFRQEAEEQLAWLEDTLAKSKADWVIVCGHYPVFSGGEHGNTPTLIAKVKPLLEKYQVDAYLSGHDHTLQHLSEGNVEYYVNGNGCLRGSIKAIPQTEFAAVDPGFAIHQIKGDSLTTTYIDSGGRPLYQHQAKRKRS